MNKYPILFILILAACGQGTSDTSEVVFDCDVTDPSIRIFKPCKKFTYSARYWDSDFNLLSEEKIVVMPTGKLWLRDTTQIEVQIVYDTDLRSKDFLKEFYLNEKLKERNFKQEITTGYVENNRFALMHPFRENQYNFTQICPFPEVIFPIQIGAKWEGRLNVHEGWGDWSDSNLESNMEIIDKDNISVNDVSYESWRIIGSSIGVFGQNSATFWFNEELGFVKLHYKNFKGQTLLFELISASF